jgi:excisionase family DNA binding protein
MMTTKDAAVRLGCKRVTVLKAIHQGRLSAQKMGRDWIVIEDEKFNCFEIGTPGRPPKNSRSSAQE